MKKIITLGCFALLTAVGCKKTTNVYYADPNQQNGNPGSNNYTEPINDTLLCGETTIDSSQWAFNASQNTFEVFFTQADKNTPEFVSYIIDMKKNTAWHETPETVDGGALLSHQNTSSGFKIVLSSTNGTTPWIPQYVTIKVYVVIKNE